MTVRHLIFCWLSSFLLITVTLNSAEAHSFKIGFLAPFTGNNLIQGQDAFDAILLAANELDWHPDNESEGHLGGLDVYISKIDTNQNKSVILHDIEQIIEYGDIKFLTGLIPAKLKSEIILRHKSTDVQFIDTPLKDIEKLKTMSGEYFKEAYNREYGRSPSLQARQGYRIGRIIDYIVRTIEGDFSDRNQIDFVLKQILGAI